MERVEVEAVARAALTERLRAGDPLFAPWQDATVGKAVAVHDVAGPQSYWLVPLVVAGWVIGFVRVGLKGCVEAVGVTCRRRERLKQCPVVATGIPAEEALARVHAEGGLAPDEVLTVPRFVHDGPKGREAWLVESTARGVARRWFFVSSGGIYVRPAGVRHGEDPSVE